MKIEIYAYKPFLNEVIEKINIARINASIAINYNSIQLNYDIGKLIVNRQEKYGWGKSIVERLSKDLREIFHGSERYSVQNLLILTKAKNDKINKVFSASFISRFTFLNLSRMRN